MVDRSYDLAVIGGGIIGLATAMKLTADYPSLKVAVLEKEDKVAEHQTGHNSG
ncbi:MAG TPA: FAD-dependent oxidoreductase, partial [Dehalococcoidia bacterium]|nr:FAD-dependent oxidoreductase [Dehalococcoidia bacterium]